MNNRTGDIDNDGLPVNVADLVYFETNLSTISNNPNLQVQDVNRDNIVDASDVEYLANHILGVPGYELPTSGLYFQNKDNGKIAIGYSNSITGTNSIIIGNNSSVDYDNSIAIGNNITIDNTNQIVIGDANSNIVLNGSNNFNNIISSELNVHGDISGNTANLTGLNVDGDISGNTANLTGLNVDGDISGNIANLTGLNVDGNVGIGTTSPETVLDVSGDLLVQNGLIGLGVVPKASELNYPDTYKETLHVSKFSSSGEPSRSLGTPLCAKCVRKKSKDV